MGLKTTVIINEVNNLNDARYCAGMGVDYLGFLLEENHPNYISKEKFDEITSWVSGPEIIGEFSNYSLNEIISTLTKYSIKVVQVKDYQIVNDLFYNEYSVILEIESTQFSEKFFQKYKGKVNYFLLVGKNDPEVLHRAGEYAARYPIILGGNFYKEYLYEINRFPFNGIALKGGTEIIPGYGDFNELADILELLEMED